MLRFFLSAMAHCTMSQSSAETELGPQPGKGVLQMLPEGLQWGQQFRCRTDRVISHVRVLGGGQRISQKHFFKGKFSKSYIILRQAFVHKKAVMAILMTRVT